MAAGTSHHVRWLGRPTPAVALRGGQLCNEPSCPSPCVQGLHFGAPTSDHGPRTASHTAEARQREPVIILENPSDTDLHKREVRPC